MDVPGLTEAFNKQTQIKLIAGNMLPANIACPTDCPMDQADVGKKEIRNDTRIFEKKVEIQS